MKTSLRSICRLVAAISAATHFITPVVAQEAMVTPSIKINGRGEVSAAPDLAVIRVGATAQAKEASAAQKEVSGIVSNALNQLRELGIPRSAISSAGVTLSPVYSHLPPRDGRPEEPRITGYRASNILRVQLTQLDLAGKVIDGCVAAGANELHGLTFELKNDTEQRKQALRAAVQEARAKADAIADGLKVRLGPLLEVVETGHGISPPQMEMGRTMMMAADNAGTPVEPGQVRIEASVQVRYRIEPE